MRRGVSFCGNTRSIAYVASAAVIADVTDDKIDYSAYSDVLTKYVQGALSGEALAFTEETATVGVGAKTQLSLNTTAKLSVEYTSDDEEVATVSANGEVTGVSAGEATITAKIGTLFSATTTVTVEDNRTRDDLLAEQYTTEAIAGYPYTYAKGSVSVQKVSGNAVTMPTGFEGESYLQYNVDNDTAGKNLYGYAISMNKGITSVADKPASALLQNEFNVTDWSNAYVGFWVYQQSDMDFRVYHFGKVLTNDAEVYNFGNNALSESIAKNTWTYVEWKLTDFNASYTSNPFAMDSYFLRVGFGYKSSASVAIGELDQIFYIAGFDIYNKNIDDMLVGQYTTEAIAGYPYTYAKGSVSVQKVSDNAVTMPTGFEGETYLQYNVDNDTAGKNLYGYAISMNKGITGVADMPASVSLQNEFNVTDWSNAYVGFWVYQQSDMDFRVYHFGKVLTNDAEVYNFGNNALSESIAKNTWTYVEWKLTDFNASYTSNPFAMDSYFLRVGFGYKSSASVAIGALDQTFYIAGFDIYSKKAESEITRDDLLAETYVPDARAELEYMHAVGQVSVKNTSGSALTMPANFAGTSYLQYDITNESTLSSGNYHGYAIAMDSSKYPINENLLAKFSVTDWSNAYVGFWVYNDSNYTLNMYAQHETNFSAADTETVTTEKGAWTYVEWALTYFDASYTTNPFELAKYFLRIGFGFRVTGITTVGGLDATFYIAGFDIYTGSKAA